jgi:hypothetical protein
MKKSIIITYLLLITYISSYGQWYKNRYNVNDINSLTKEQLEESLGKSKKSLAFSGIIAGFGGAVFLVARYVGFEESEDPGFVEELIGEEGMNDIAIGTGAGLLIGGTIASIACLGRMARIRSVINKNYPSLEGLNISPSGVYNCYTRSFCPGITITCNF